MYVCTYDCIWCYCHCFLIEAVSEHNLHDFGSITLCQWPRSISDSFSLSSTPLLFLCDSFPEFRSYSFILKIKQKNVFLSKQLKVFSSHHKSLTCKSKMSAVCCTYIERSKTHFKTFLFLVLFVLFWKALRCI